MGVKSYANSYLYTRVPNYEKNILEFVMKAERINKSNEAFFGIIEDTKRRQTSAVLSRVLAREDVIICIYSKPLPSSFKVFACKDVKTDGKVKVFIDCTGLITMKNGFFNCSKIDVFCTYLLNAMTTLVYHQENLKIVTNSTITMSGTECFVALATHIFDYLRLNGYSENRAKIAYIFAMYFQVGILGLNRDSTSTMNLAAKVAGIQMRDINAMEIYYHDEDLINIDTVLKCITDTFKTKGMSTDVFIDKWTWFYGTGTHFGTELFTAFAAIITDAYCGSYVNNQKTIEKCCGRSMVSFTTALLRVGSDVLDEGFRYESSIDRDCYGNKSNSVLQEGLFGPKIPKEEKVTTTDLTGDTKKLEKKVTSLSKYYTNPKEKSKFAKGMYLSAIGTIQANYMQDASTKYNGMLSSIVGTVNRYLLGKERDYVINGLSSSIRSLTKNIKEDKNVNQNTKAIRDDCKKALKIVDPKNAILKESFQPENSEAEKEAIDEASIKKPRVPKEEDSDVNLTDAKEIIKARIKEIVWRYNRDTNIKKKIRKDIDRAIITFDEDDEFDGFKENRNVPKLQYGVKEESDEVMIFCIYDGSTPVKVAIHDTVEHIKKDLMKCKDIKSLLALHQVHTGEDDKACIYVEFKK